MSSCTIARGKSFMKKPTKNKETQRRRIIVVVVVVKMVWIASSHLLIGVLLNNYMCVYVCVKIQCVRLFQLKSFAHKAVCSFSQSFYYRNCSKKRLIQSIETKRGWIEVPGISDASNKWVWDFNDLFFRFCWRCLFHFKFDC